MDVRTISVVAVVLGTAVYAIYEFFANERNRNRQHGYQDQPRSRTNPPRRSSSRVNNGNNKEQRSFNANEDCTICLGTLQRGVVIKTACQHQFHCKCLLSWHKENPKCPNCRSTISLDDCE